MKRRALAIIIGTCWTLATQGQIEDYKTSKIIPASPTSAALGKFGEVPVSLFNGTPSINIPLYNIKTPAHNLNISMAYDASGTKVTEDASWVGFHWSLLAGGAITRTIMQKDDLNNSERGFNSYNELPELVDWDTRGSYFNDVYRGYTDVEPDIFSYNFCGKAGRFVMGKDDDGSPIFQDQKNELKVFFDLGNWIITDGLGYKYYFSTKEVADNYYYSGDFRATEFSELTYYTGLGWNPLTTDNNQTVSAWYLDSVVAQTGEVLKFTYQTRSSLSLVSLSENFYRTWDHESMTCSGSSTFPIALFEFTTYSASRQEIFNVHLKKIEFSNGSIEFAISGRSDIEVRSVHASTGPAKLDTITVKNSNGTKIKSFVFYYGYFNSANTQGRLKLDSLVEVGSSGERLPPHKFRYYNPNSLPPKISASMDHWGYWNGAANQSLLFYSFGLNPFGQIVSSVPYGNRDADETYNYPANGVLSSITYPTGGSTSFEYELHEFGDLSGEMAYKTLYKDTAAFNNPLNPSSEPYKVVEFTIPPLSGISEMTLILNLTYQNIVGTSLPDSGSTGPVFALFQQIDNSGNVLSTKYSRTTDQIHELTGEDSQGFTVGAGKYRLSVGSSNEWQYYLQFSWIERDTLTTRKGGGIRVKSIRTVDSIGVQTVKKYVYKNNQDETSGILFKTPKYDARFWIYGQAEEIAINPCKYMMDLYTIKASNIFPSGLISSPGIVGYKQVTELEGENGENGKTVYYYHCTADYVSSFPGVPSTSDAFNGKLDSVFVYDSSGTVVKRTNYKYKSSGSDALRGAKMYAMPTGIVPEPGNAYEVIFYDIYSVWVTPDEETEIIYAGSNAISTTKKYYYDNSKHRALTKEIVVQSNGDTLITKFIRPDDYTVSGGNSFVEKMRDKHIISPVIEQQTLLKQGATSKLVSGTFAAFSKFNNQFFKPDTIYGIKTSSPLTDTTVSTFLAGGKPSIHANYSPQIYFDQYNAAGGLTSMHERNNMAKSYVWGYDNIYPIAEALNAVPKDIFHTSFEDADGNSADGDSKTGRKSKTNGYSKSLSNLTDGDYILSYWKKSSGVWTLQRDTVTVSGGSYPIAISASLQVDEVRFYPKTAKMTTYAYEPLVGMTSQCDANNRVTYYKYDGLGRLQTILDQDRNVLRTYDYKYQQNNNQ